MRAQSLALAILCLASCAQTPPDATEAARPAVTAVRYDGPRSVRLTGVVEAVRSTRVGVPQLSGPATRLTLTSLIPNGTIVEADELVARFDPLVYLGILREATSQFEDLRYQVRQKEAENFASSEQRRSDLEEAEADLAKSLLEVSKAEILSEVDREQNELRAERARQHVESLQKSNADHDAAEAAALRILDLQRDREERRVDRVEANLERLQVRAPIAGMVAHVVTYRGGSMARAQEGDQLYRNTPLLSIFDPTEMLIRCEVGEPDRALLVPGLDATVYVDAYPDMALRAHFESASPIASSALGSPVKTFTAIFRLDETDPRLMPDLSAAVVLDVAEPAAGAGAAP